MPSRLSAAEASSSWRRLTKQNLGRMRQDSTGLPGQMFRFAVRIARFRKATMSSG